MEVQTDLALDLLVWEVPLVLRDRLVDRLGVLWEVHLVDHSVVQNLLALEDLEVILHCYSSEAEAGVH